MTMQLKYINRFEISCRYRMTPRKVRYFIKKYKIQPIKVSILKSKNEVFNFRFHWYLISEIEPLLIQYGRKSKPSIIPADQLIILI